MVPPEDKRRVVGDVINIREISVELYEVVVVKFTKPGVEFSNSRQVTAVGGLADVQ